MNIIDIKYRDPSLTRIFKILSKFEENYDDTKNKICLDLNNIRFISTSALVVLNMYLYNKKKKKNDIEIDIVNIDSDVDTYLSRIDFYKNLDIPKTENFHRWSSRGRFTTIKRIKKDGYLSMTDEIMEILYRDEKNFNLALKYSLDWSINELIDNVFEHSQSESGCMLAAQTFDNKGKIDICIVDLGIGIDRSLRQAEQYQLLAPLESLEKATEKEVTKGTGQGNGLYYSKKFIEENEGKMSIISNDNLLRITNGEIFKKRLNYGWKGTIIELSICKNKDIDVENVFEKIPVGYKEFIEDHGVITLW